MLAVLLRPFEIQKNYVTGVQNCLTFIESAMSIMASKISLSLLALLIVLLPIYALAESLIPNRSAISSASASNIGMRGSKESPIVVETAQSIEDQTEIRAKAKERAEKLISDQETLALARGALAVSIVALLAALTQAGLFVWQLLLLKRALMDSTKAANAAHDSVENAKLSAERQLRAYALIKSVEIQSTGSDNFVKIMIWNFGQTPATTVKYWLHVDSGEKAISAQPKRPSEETKESQIAIIAPNDGTEISAPIPLVEGDAEIHEGKKALYVFGKFEYIDAFGKQRSTSLCYTRTGNKWLIDGDMYQCDVGNEAT